MKNNKESIEPISKRTILLINISLVLISILFIGGVVSVIRYKKQEAEQQKVLLLQQQRVLESLKTSFPDYRNSQDYKEKTEMAIPKISVDEVQEGGASIEADVMGIGSSVATNGDCSPSFNYNWDLGGWEITRDNVVIASDSNRNGWDMEGGLKKGVYPLHPVSEHECQADIPGHYKISIPVTAQPGTYSFEEMDFADVFSERVNFEITPPCPAGVELTITPQG